MASPESLVSRGRGRGRGLAASSSKKPGGEPVVEKSVREYILQLQPSEVQSTVAFLTRPSSNAQEVLNEAVNEICSRVLKDVDFVKLAVELINKLWDLNLPESVSIRKPLLSRLQELYKSRDNLLEDELQGYAALLCDLFSILRISEQPLKAFVGPVFKVLKDLLDRNDSAQGNILTFHVIISKHGCLLEKQEKTKMAELIDEIRNAALAESKNKIRQCIFLEVIELHACNWQMANDVRLFYSDTLAELMERIQEQ